MYKASRWLEDLIFDYYNWNRNSEKRNDVEVSATLIGANNTNIIDKFATNWDTTARHMLLLLLLLDQLINNKQPESTQFNKSEKQWKGFTFLSQINFCNSHWRCKAANSAHNALWLAPNDGRKTNTNKWKIIVLPD